MRAIIDRFEEDKAVVEVDGEMLIMPRALFAGAQEGDHVEITVLGKPQKESEDAHDEIPEIKSVSADKIESAEGSDPSDDPHSIFERLRAKRKRKNLLSNNDPGH